MKNSIKGVSAILLSGLFFRSYGLWAKLIGSSLGDFYQTWTRMVLISAILLPIGFATKSFIRVKKRDIKWFAIVTLSGAATFAPYFYAFNHLAIGTATLLFYAALTITIYIVGKLFLKEKMTLVKLASLIIALVGLSLIFTISFGQGLLIPALAAIFAGSAGGCEVAFTKKISGSYSSVQITTILFLRPRTANPMQTSARRGNRYTNMLFLSRSFASLNIADPREIAICEDFLFIRVGMS